MPPVGICAGGYRATDIPTATPSLLNAYQVLEEGKAIDVDYGMCERWSFERERLLSFHDCAPLNHGVGYEDLRKLRKARGRELQERETPLLYVPSMGYKARVP